MKAVSSVLGAKEIGLLLSRGHGQERLHPLVRRGASFLGSLAVRIWGYPLDALARERAQAILEALAPQPGERFLALGCHIGHLALELGTSHPIRVDGLEEDTHCLAIAQRLREKLDAWNVSFMQQKGPYLHFLAESFDKAFAELLKEGEAQEAYFAEVNRVLVDGGDFVFVLPMVGNGAAWPQVASALEEAGFVLEEKRLLEYDILADGLLTRFWKPLRRVLSLSDGQGGPEVLVKARKARRPSYHR